MPQLSQLFSRLFTSTTWWVLAGVASLLFIYWWRKAKLPLSASRKRWILFLRIALIALLAAALSDLRFPISSNQLAVGVVLDPGPAVSASERRSALEAFRAAAGQHSRVRTELPQNTNASTGRTSWTGQIITTAARLPQDRTRRMVIATDGQDPQNRLAHTIASLADDGFEVDLYPLGREGHAGHVALINVVSPDLVRTDEEVDVRAVIQSRTAQPASIRFRLGDQDIATVNQDLVVGENNVATRIRFPGEPGVYRLTAQLTTSPDPNLTNNRFTRFVEVLPKPRVRVIHPRGNQPQALFNLLTLHGLDPHGTEPMAMPTTWQGLANDALIISNEIDLAQIPEASQRAIRNWVENEGGGFIEIVGGEPVRRTPEILRAISPLDPPPALPEPRPLELMLVIDRSGSMSGYPMEQARRAGVAAIRSLRPGALVGVVAFSGGADVAIPPVPVEQSQRVQAYVAGLQAAGGTNIAAAIRAANGALSNDPRYMRHVILISDGESEPQAAIASAMALAGRGVTITAVTIGAPSELLNTIAQIGRGRYHATSAAGLASIVVSEARARSSPPARNQAFSPTAIQPLAMFEGFSFQGMPALGGHALASVRDGATHVFQATDEMPLLAHWTRGQGQVAAFTSSVANRWADGARRSSQFSEFFRLLTKGMLRSRSVDVPRLSWVDVVDRPDVLGLNITSPFPDNSLVPVVRSMTSGRVPEAAVLEPRGPGMWYSEIARAETVIVDARMPYDLEPTAALGYQRPYAPTLAEPGVRTDHLTALARLGGGRLIENPSDAFRPGEANELRRSLRGWFLLLALVVYLLSILMIRWPDRGLGKGQLERPSRTSIPSRGRPSYESLSAMTGTNPDSSDSSDTSNAGKAA